MVEILSASPILLLFVVASIGYFFGNIKIGGRSLGVAAILFTGLAFGAIDSRLQIPEIVFLLGLSLFVYSVGLRSGPAFFQSYRKNGLSEILFILSMLAFSGLVATGLWYLLGFSAAEITGIYTGSTTNTAALAGVIDAFNNNYSPEEAAKLTEEAVVGYSYSYPMGVFGGMIAIVLMERLFRIDYKKEMLLLRKDFPLEESLSSATIEVTNPALSEISLRELFKREDWKVVFGRVYSDGRLQLAHWELILHVGDIIMAVGSKEELEEVVAELGQRVDTKLTHDRTQFDVRRIFVSNAELAGRTIASLNINEKYNAIITRIRRGDMEMLATGDTILELGDRIRFIAHREDLQALSTYFGDSYQEASKVNLFSFGAGIGLGLILGSINFHFGEGVDFKLGYAGGPLVVGLILGALRRTGPILWTLPYGANVTLQQMGLIFLLAAVGVRSGHAFEESISTNGVWIFFASAVISLLTALTILFVGYKILKKPFSLLMGMVSNQPAILDFATNRTNNRIPEFGFSMMFPLALIMKVLIAQILFLVLS
ncbi:MAG: hypothetical protein KDC34_20725 [Saprospiraceae bacterium]|nr:hypothetical protein [Saprospiraceae bacterium]